jgi:hypothetical protein
LKVGTTTESLSMLEEIMGEANRADSPGATGARCAVTGRADPRGHP